MVYLWLKLVHVANAAFLFGTGAGTAYFMLRSYLYSRARGKAGVQVLAVTTRHVIQADWVFTLGSGVLQLLTGLLLALQLQLPLLEGWVALALATFFAVFLCWAPAALLQARIYRLAGGDPGTAMQAHSSSGNLSEPPLDGLPRRIHRYMRIWAVLGLPAFAGMVVLFYLMVFKPNL